MSAITNLIHQPRRLFLRKVLFQVHLWAGILLSLYLIIISLTGAILVFEDELTATTLPTGLHSYNPTQSATIPQVVHTFTATHPDAKIEFLILPTPTIPAFQLRATDLRHSEFNLVADPQTAVIHDQPRNWLNVVHDLHVYLLFAESHGIQINGIGAAILLLLAITGLCLWWPGLRVWTRGLRISLHHNWRRINYDTHNAIGIWTLAIVTWWAISGIYFAWYRQVAAAINVISPIRNMISPTTAPAQPPIANVIPATLDQILISAHKASPHGTLFALSSATLHTPTILAEIDLAKPGDFSHRDLVTLDTATARVLSIWHYGQNQSLGDWILWSMHPLHFGTLWGLPFKILWFLLGLTLALLTATGLLMYWNRYLRRRWSSLQAT
jgi:uncharacterized iron-regulated membrane protein